MSRTRKRLFRGETKPPFQKRGGDLKGANNLKISAHKTPYGFGFLIVAFNKADTWCFSVGIASKWRVRTQAHKMVTVYFGLHADNGPRDDMKILFVWPVMFGFAKRA